MLIYRALLIDTTKSYQRPVQQFFNDVEVARDWANKVLAVAGKGAEVTIYVTSEMELMTIAKPVERLPSDKDILQDLRQAAK